MRHLVCDERLVVDEVMTSLNTQGFTALGDDLELTATCASHVYLLIGRSILRRTHWTNRKRKLGESRGKSPDAPTGTIST